MELDECWRIAVVVPARDEADLVARCVRSVQRSVAALVDPAAAYVVVVADACIDATADVAHRALATTNAAVVRCDAANVGVARQAGVERALQALAPHTLARTWVAMTDADSEVPPDWLPRHLSAAANGWHAVVGAIAVDDWRGRDPRTAARLARYRAVAREHGVNPVHGANLGVRGDALRAIGGVPGHALSEDAAMVAALDLTGLSVLRASDLTVQTSARRSHRAPGGFSDLLDDLETNDLETNDLETNDLETNEILHARTRNAKVHP